MKRVQEKNINPVPWTLKGLNREYNRKDRIETAKEIAKHIDPEDNILDVCSGGGSVLKRLRELGLKNRIDVTDGDQVALDFILVHKFLDINITWLWNVENSSMIESLSRDIVIASDVIEHVDYPQDFVNKLLYVARKKVIITCPYKNSYPHKEHVWEFDERDFTIFGRDRCKNIFIKDFIDYKKKYLIVVYEL